MYFGRPVLGPLIFIIYWADFAIFNDLWIVSFISVEADRRQKVVNR